MVLLYEVVSVDFLDGASSAVCWGVRFRVTESAGVQMQKGVRSLGAWWFIGVQDLHGLWA